MTSFPPSHRRIPIGTSTASLQQRLDELRARYEALDVEELDALIEEAREAFYIAQRDPSRDAD